MLVNRTPFESLTLAAEQLKTLSTDELTMLASESETVSRDFKVPDEQRIFYRRFAAVFNELVESGDGPT